MARTVINIPGVNEIVFNNLAMDNITQIRNFLKVDYPQIDNMQDSMTTAPNGDVTVTFSQRTGTKGALAGVEEYTYAAALSVNFFG